MAKDKTTKCKLIKWELSCNANITRYVKTVLRSGGTHTHIHHKPSEPYRPLLMVFFGSRRFTRLMFAVAVTSQPLQKSLCSYSTHLSCDTVGLTGCRLHQDCIGQIFQHTWGLHQLSCMSEASPWGACGKDIYSSLSYCLSISFKLRSLVSPISFSFSPWKVPDVDRLTKNSSLQSREPLHYKLYQPWRLAGVVCWQWNIALFYDLLALINVPFPTHGLYQKKPPSHQYT